MSANAGGVRLTRWSPPVEHIEVFAEHRGRGLDGALLSAEGEVARHGVAMLGLSLFGKPRGRPAVVRVRRLRRDNPTDAEAAQAVGSLTV